MTPEDGAPRHGVSARRLSHANVLAIAVPIILSNVTTPLIGIVDTAVLGQLGDPHYIGAVAVGAMIFNMLYWAFGFLRMGTTGLVAQAEGTGDAHEVTATLLRALLIAGIAGVLLIVLQAAIAAGAFVLIEGTRAVEDAAASYFTIRIWGAPAALANYALLGWFIGRGRAGTAFALQILLNGTNAALDALFVMGFGLGVEGVAYGTLMAETLAAGCGLWLAAREIGRRNAWVSRARTLEKAAIKRALSVNGDIMIRTLCLLAAFSWFTVKSAESGDVLLAANAILLNLLHFAAYFLDGFAFAAESLVGQAIGSKRRDRFLDAVRMSSLWAVVLGGLLSLVFWFAGGIFIDLMTVNAEVRAEARVYLFWAALAPITGVAAYQLDGIFIGATRTADMRNMMLLCLAFYLGAWAVLTPLYANHGLWAAQILFFAIRGVTLAVRYPALVRAAFALAPRASPA